MQETAEDAVTKATEALGKLDKVEELVENAETAAGEAQEAANQAQEIVDAAPREYIPTIVGGYWYINGQNTGVKAEGEDGLDGSRVVRHLIHSVDELPSSGATCNPRHIYYLGLPDTLHSLEAEPDNSGKWNAWCVSADLVPHGVTLSGLVVPSVGNTCSTPQYIGVYLQENNVRRGLLTKSTASKSWTKGQDVRWDFAIPFEVPDGAGIEVYLAANKEDISEDSIPGPGIHIMSPCLNEGISSCRYGAMWYGGRSPYLGFTSPNAGQVIVYEWFDGHGWVSLAGNAAQMIRPASASVDGVVKLGSDQVLEDGAPVCTNAEGQMQVPRATAARADAVLLSRSTPITTGAPIGYDSSGRLVADAAELDGRRATQTPRKIVVDVPFLNPLLMENTEALAQSSWGTVHASRAFVDALTNRMQNATTLGESKSTAAWLSVLGGAGRISWDGARAGSDWHLSGAAFGMQQQLSPRSALGLAIGNSWGKVSTFGAPAIDQDTTHIALYGDSTLLQREKDALTLSWSAAYGRTESDLSSRGVSYDWEQKVLQLNARATYGYALSERTILSGFAGLEYLATDSGDIVTSATTGSVQNLRGEIGVSLGHKFSDRSSMYAELSFVGDMVRNNPTAEVGGVRSKGSNPGRAGINFSVGGSHALNENWSVNASYNLELMQHANSHSANIGFNRSF